MINTRTIALADIAPNTGQIPGVPANPRIIQDGRFTKLVRSLKDDPEMMELRELLVYEQDGTFVVIGGNMRLKALKHIGATEAPCKVIPADWPAEKLRAIATKDNVSFGEFDWDALVEGWDRGELDDWGVDFPAITKPKKGLTDPDAVPPVTKEAVTRSGDIWALGDHRIICGDSTEADTVAKCLNGVKPHLMVTDPPYGVEYDASWRAEVNHDGVDSKRAVGKVLNDDRADWREAWALFPGDVAYVWHADVYSPVVAESLEACGFVMRALVIWAKQRHTFGRGHYHHMHEPLWYAVKKGGTGHWAGDRKQTTLWQIDNNRNSETGHSTQKPVECMKRPIENNSSPGQAVYEPFSGSGTTIIAGEMTGRSIHAIELSPTYVDVAVKRWQDFTGKEAILMSTGETFAQRAEAQAITA